MTFDRNIDRFVKTKEGEVFHLEGVARFLQELGRIPRSVAHMVDIPRPVSRIGGLAAQSMEEDNSHVDDAEVLFFPGPKQINEGR